MDSTSPYGKTYSIDPASGDSERIDGFIKANRPRKCVVVQGLGFVGAAMATALSNVRSPEGLVYAVIGVDLASEMTYWKIAAVNEGVNPIISLDSSLDRAFRDAHEAGNLIATHDPYAYNLADVIVVDVNLDAQKPEGEGLSGFEVDMDGFRRAIRQAAAGMKQDCLLLTETTVPPGTSENVVAPIVRDEFSRRGLDPDAMRLAYSYERVMPGAEYLRSITNFFRVYAGIDDLSADAARMFLESFINVRDFPLSRVHSLTACEMGKVLENSFRAANIALIQEWTEFAESAGVNLFEVISAIRVRSTHQNIMLPGFGVGGYCLTKDSLLAEWAYRHFFDETGSLGVSLKAVEINDMMPLHTIARIKQGLGSLQGKSILLLGISYLNDISDTRNSPAEIFYDACLIEGASVYLHDPLVNFWPEKGLKVETSLDAALSAGEYDAVVFSVRHVDYTGLDAGRLASALRKKSLIVDAFDILDNIRIKSLLAAGHEVIGIGKGHIDELKKQVKE
jgi:nucleotide sugar dehydrogenase